MKPRKPQICYWDSSVFIAFLNGEAGSENIEQLLDEAEAGELHIVTSSFTLVEVIKMKGRLPILVAEQKKITAFFEKDYFLFVDATREITEAARELIWKVPKLWPKDSVHLASAMFFGAAERLDAIHSYDDDFLSLNGKLPITCPICRPMPSQPLLVHVPPKRRKRGD